MWKAAPPRLSGIKPRSHTQKVPTVEARHRSTEAEKRTRPSCRLEGNRLFLGYESLPLAFSLATRLCMNFGPFFLVGLAPLRAAESRRLGFGWSLLCTQGARTWDWSFCSTQEQWRRHGRVGRALGAVSGRRRPLRIAGALQAKSLIHRLALCVTKEPL